MQQTMSRPQPNMPPNSQNGGPARTQSLIITAITLLALSGLIIGFAVGAVTRPQQAAQPTAVPTVNPVAQKAQPTTAPKAEAQPLNCPSIDGSDGGGVADGTTIHTFLAHAVAKTGTSSACTHGQALQSPGITCKLWLSKVPDNNGIVKIKPDELKNTASISQPFTEEVQNVLVFDPTTPQTHACDDKGQGMWKFSISPDAKKGDYYLVVLNAWGIYANWSWVGFHVSKAG
jgi:hypothetical protein